VTGISPTVIPTLMKVWKANHDTSPAASTWANGSLARRAIRRPRKNTTANPASSQIVDYLYLSLTNATAFSPTDTMPLTRHAKTAMGLQSAIALVTIGLAIARVANILK